MTNEEVLYAVMDGSLGQELRNARREVADKQGTLYTLRADIQNMPESETRTAALAKAEQAWAVINGEAAMLNDALARYDEVVGLIRTYSLGMITPEYSGSLSGLGVVQIGAGVVVAALIGVAAVSALTYAIAALRGKSAETRTIITDLADLIKAPGTFVSDVGGGIVSFAEASQKVIPAVLVGVGLYVLYRFAQSKGYV
jgi:hypothetical protein